MIEPLHVTLDLACSRDHAFATWVGRFGQWWPRTHTTSGDPHATVHLEARKGGRIFERTSDGRETDWGEVVAWNPPHGLEYLWHIRRDRSDATEVRLSFHERDEGGCRLEIEHTGWERLGAEGQPWRDANRGGWSGLLPHFEAACG
jgi:Activator of Hsp90 ATPase homolog 1-like protein